MKFTRYSKFDGLDVFGINLGDLMEGLSDSLLSSGYDDDYYWSRQRMPRAQAQDERGRRACEPPQIRRVTASVIKTSRRW